MKKDKTLEKVNKTINDVFNSFVLKEEATKKAVKCLKCSKWHSVGMGSKHSC